MVFVSRLRAKSSTVTLDQHRLLTPISVVYRLIQHIPAVTIATPMGLENIILKGDGRNATKETSNYKSVSLRRLIKAHNETSLRCK